MPLLVHVGARWQAPAESELPAAFQCELFEHVELLRIVALRALSEIGKGLVSFIELAQPGNGSAYDRAFIFAMAPGFERLVEFAGARCSRLWLKKFHHRHCSRGRYRSAAVDLSGCE
jgi:hypothetical protein